MIALLASTTIAFSLSAPHATAASAFTRQSTPIAALNRRELALGAAFTAGTLCVRAAD